MTLKKCASSATLLTLALVATFLAGCFPPADLPREGGSAMPQGSINGSEWQLVSVGGAPGVLGSEATILFSAGRVSGATGCNRYNGPYTETANGVLEFGPIASTMMACPQPQMVQEQAFLKALDATARYSLSGGILTLTGANGEELATFGPRKSVGLVGANWSATGINNGRQAVVSLVSGSQVTAIFASDGRMSGNAGCNSYSAAYAVDGNNIKIEPPVHTEMACLEAGVMEQEQAYFTALGKATTYLVDGDLLELRDETGALQVGFRAEK